MKAFSSAIQLFVSRHLDNSSFYIPQLEKHCSNIDITIDTIEEGQFPHLNILWVPVVLFPLEMGEHPYIVQLLQNGLLQRANNYFYTTSAYSQENRVYLNRPHHPNELRFFKQASCIPCQSTIRLLQRYQVPYEIENSRSELWYEIGVHKTPAFLWENRYFFETIQGFKLTSLRYLLPSERNT